MAMKKASPKKTEPKPPTPKEKAKTAPGRSSVKFPAPKETPQTRAMRLQLELRKRQSAKVDKIREKFLAKKNKNL
jgi:hypothetical protein